MNNADFSGELTPDGQIVVLEHDLNLGPLRSRHRLARGWPTGI